MQTQHLQLFTFIVTVLLQAITIRILRSLQIVRVTQASHTKHHHARHNRKRIPQISEKLVGQDRTRNPVVKGSQANRLGGTRRCRLLEAYTYCHWARLLRVLSRTSVLGWSTQEAKPFEAVKS